MDSERQFSSIFLIVAKSKLRQVLEINFEDTVVFELCKPVVWEQIASIDKASLRYFSSEIIEAYLIKIKLGFLLHLWDLWVNEETIESLQRAVKMLLGEAPIEYTVFDQWWEVSDVKHIVSEKELKLMSAYPFSVFAKTGNELADTWINNLLAEKPKP